MWNWLVSFGAWLVEQFGNLIEGIKEAFWWFFTEFYGWIFTEMIAKIQTQSNALGFTADYSWSVETYNWLNFFFPVNETLSLLTVCLAFWVGCWVLKICLKLIPTVY